MKLKEKIIIAIDGFSSCGKSTFAKLIAQQLHYIFIDTGAMYRAVALFALRNNLIYEDVSDNASLINRLNEVKIHFNRHDDGKLCTYLNGENVEDEIRGVEVSKHVSDISQLKEVRELLVEIQQKMGNEKGIVMDGRDIGTVVFPSAEIKIYMTASSLVRAKRRFDELTEKGVVVSLDEIQQNIEDRDHKDLTRETSPLRQADDAFVLDNSRMTIAEQLEWFKKLLIERQFIAQ